VSTAVVLDSGPVGDLSNPKNPPHVAACRHWVATVQAVGRRVILPEIADYEVRRELLRIRSKKGLANLDWLGQQLEYLLLTTDVMRRAAELWAQARQQGRPTAGDQTLDADVILAAQALSLGVPVIVATANVSHVSRFVPADLWQNIAP
jgi:predicted nucleic acid-binding protein